MEEDEGAPARRKLLQNLAERVLIPSYEDARKRAVALAKASDALAASPSEANLQAARSAWKRAMIAWERVEVLQVGPAASESPLHPGGRSLREQIYFWPGINACGIDRCLVTKCYGEAEFKKASLPDVRGLPALEVLLFDERTETACPADHTVVTAKAWKAIAGELPRRRAAYARACADDVARRAGQLVDAWRDGFLAEFADAGVGSETFETTRDALAALTSALSYVATATTDLKLGRPAFCIAEDCASSTEHKFARTSKQAILANLSALGDVFAGRPPSQRGGEMWGLFDLAQASGETALASRLDTLLFEAERAVDAIDGDLEDASAVHAPELKAAFDALEALTGPLKTDLPNALSVTAKQ